MGITKFVFHKLLGWKIEGSFSTDLKKAVVIVVPHTSWHDFYVGAFTRRIIRVEINFVAKKELFKWPFGWYFRWMGGAPLDRTSGQNKVESIAQIFRSKEEFRLALAPEGTRKKVEQWKTGYYYIAVEAGVPIIPVAFNYSKKTVTIHPPFEPSGNIETDTPKIMAHYEGVVGKKPEYT
ncbi:MAG: 1-acyl-sn-glycerol-3-phosphate acyltransferase [Bacteroidota bacterium]